MERIVLVLLFIATITVTGSVCSSLSKDRRWLFGNSFGGQSHVDYSNRCKVCYDCHCNRSISHCAGWGPDCFELEKGMDCHAGYQKGGVGSPWGHWKQCQGDCGKLGTRHRHRSCVPKTCVKTCTLSLTDTESCHMPLCDTVETTSPTNMTNVAITTDAPTVIPTMHSSESGFLPRAPAECHKLCTVTPVANGNNYHSVFAPSCPNESRTTPEALLMECCKITAPVAWQRGAHVMSRCRQTAHYAPIGRFDNDHYQPGSAGVFIECSEDTTTGFLMALQSCNAPPTLEHVTNNGTTRLDHPEMYYFIH